MTIDRLGPIDPVSKYHKTSTPGKAGQKAPKDSVSISSDAKAMAEVYRAVEMAKAVPDVRMDRVEEVKAKLQDPSYINDKVVDMVADNLMDLFGL